MWDLRAKAIVEDVKFELWDRLGLGFAPIMKHDELGKGKKVSLDFELECSKTYY